MIKNIYNKHQQLIDLCFLCITFVTTMVLSFYSAFKRFNNFEFGKFDLGNMSQMVWNSLNGRPMMLTDQFGTDMSRLGMSHFDPIILIFVPIFAVVAHPMVLVFFQHASIISTIFPLYFLSKKYLGSGLFGLLIALSFIFYPAQGYILVWTEFHGITFVSSIFLWLVLFLENKNYLVDFKKKDIVIYSILILLLLAGKEEIGAILAIYSILLWFKNKKLAVSTFIVSLLWFVVVFFVLIPSANSYRDQSVNDFIAKAGEENANNGETVQGKNFFYKRYSYLGDSYGEMLSTVARNPLLITKNTPIENNINTFLYLLGPLLFIPLISFAWLIGLPDFALTILSDEEIFKISNHRISFIIVAVFLSYIFGLSYIRNKLPSKSRQLVIGIIITIGLVANIIMSVHLANPLTYNLLNRLGVYKYVTPVIAQSQEDKENHANKELYKLSKTGIPENNILCLRKAADYVLSKNPTVYSGPDYLGANLSLRQTNAIYPAKIDQAQIFISDYLEDKAYEPLDSAESWTLNKKVLRNTIMNNSVKHVFSCGRINVFEKSENKEVGEVKVLTEAEKSSYDLKAIKAKKFGVDIAIVKMPTKDNRFVEYVLARHKSTDLNDKLLFWKFETATGKEVSFIDYAPYSISNNLNDISSTQALMVKMDLSFVSEFLGEEIKSVRYGISNQLDGQEIYLGEWDF